VDILGVEAANLYYPESNNDKINVSFENKSVFEQTKAETVHREVIKVIAVGGGGGNALNHIITKGIEGVQLIAANTDVRDLEKSKADNKIVLGEHTTKGLGAGARPEIGELAARESISEIREYMKDSDMVYLAAGMGGGTGTGAIPIIAQAAREMGILTVAVVTKPFSFEGGRRARFAEAGIAKLRQCVDALIIVPNDRLLDVAHSDTTLGESFAMADEILRQAVQGVTDLVTRPGLVNVDFADLRTVMKEAGVAVMGIGCASGDNRIEKALKEAVESPLMESSMSGAKGVLMNITYGSDLGIGEIQEAAEYIESIKDEDATFIWGCAENSEYEGRVEVVIVATGFDDLPAADAHTRQNARREAAQQAKQQPSDNAVAVETVPTVTIGELRPTPMIPATPQPAQPQPAAAASRVPDWLRSASASAAKEEPAEKVCLFEQKQMTSVYDSPSFTRAGRTLKKPQL